MPRAAGKKPPAAKKKVARGHVPPETLPEGEVLTDTRKKSWRLGQPVGTGGFGAVYSASEVGTNSGDYVIKIEPHGNGPLFVEMHFYMKFSKPEDIDQWVKEKKLKYIGVPLFHGHGSHEYNGTKYRFIVIDRFGRNIHSIFQKNKKLSEVATLQLAVQIVNVLEFIHSKGYCHADIKGDNLLLGWKKGCENQVFLVDFGLAELCTKAKEKPDPKKAHNGTPEYTSRDAHKGVIAKRGDLEILAYNMLHWMTGKLPWEKHLGDSVKLASSKEEYMNDVPKLMKTCFGSSKPPDCLVKFFNYVAKLDLDKIDYDKCRSICVDGLKALKSGVDRPLDIDLIGEPTTGSVTKARVRKRHSDVDTSIEPSGKKVVKVAAKKGAKAKKAVAFQKSEVAEMAAAEETEIAECTVSKEESDHDESVSNRYIDVPDSLEPPPKRSNAKRGQQNIKRKSAVNKRKSIVASVIAATSRVQKKSVGLKKRLSVVAKKLPSAAKVSSWRDFPTIASSSKLTARLLNSNSVDAQPKKRGRGRNVK